jgi:hypothetical protein
MQRSYCRTLAHAEPLVCALLVVAGAIGRRCAHGERAQSGAGALDDARINAAVEAPRWLERRRLNKGA